MTVIDTLWMRDPENGVVLLPIEQFTALEWSLRENEFGKLTASGPLTDVSPDMFQLDNRFELKRTVDGVTVTEGDTQFLLRYWAFFETKEGEAMWEIEAYTLDYILTSRIVNYPASTQAKANAYTEKTDQADDMLKVIVRENLGSSATDTTRRLSLLTVDPDVSDGPSITKAFAHKNVYAVCKDIAESSLGEGTYLAFGLVPDGDGKGLTFRTWTSQRGTDRTAAGGSPFIISKDNGNLSAPRVTFDHRTECTYVKAGGKGEGDQLATGTATDTERAAGSPFNLRELYVSGRQTSTAAALTADAKGALEENRPIRGFSGRYIDGVTGRYGIDLNFGDLITAEYLGYFFDCRIYSVRGSYSQEGERLDIDLRSEDFA